MKESIAIGIDVGGTKVVAGLVSFPSGRSLQAPRRVPNTGGSGAVLDTICSLAETLAADAAELGGKVDAIGVGICEIVLTDGKIASAATFKWSESEIKQRLSGVAPVVIEADVRAAARAEAMFGAGRELDCFLYVSVGTGISCCLVIGGEPFAGARGATGTMASGPLPTLDFKDRVSLEQIASGPALRERFRVLGGRDASTQEILEAAEAGDKIALQVVQNGGTVLGASVGWLVSVLDPGTVILGGGLGTTEGIYRKTLLEGARQFIWWPGHRDVPVLTARTGVDAGWIGAAATAWVRLSPENKKASRPN